MKGSVHLNRWYLVLNATISTSDSHGSKYNASSPFDLLFQKVYI